MGAFPLDQAYVINLKSATDRWQTIQAECSRAQISPIRVEGVLGRDLTAETRQEHATRFCAKYCQPSVIGVALSHMKCWEIISKGHQPYGMIVEDDCRFVPDFRQKLTHAFDQVPKDFDIVYVGCTGACNKDRKATKSDPIHILAAFTGLTSKQCNATGPLGSGSPAVQVCNHPNTGTVSENIFIPELPTALHCYIVSKAGAGKLLRKMRGRLNDHIDILILHHLHDLKLYALDPPLAYQPVAAETSSNLPQVYPCILVHHLKQYRDASDVGADYKVLSSLYNIHGIPINLFILLYFLAGVGCGIVGIYSLAWMTACLINLAEYALHPNASTLKSMIFSQVVFLIGLVVGLLTGVSPNLVLIQRG